VRLSARNAAALRRPFATLATLHGMEPTDPAYAARLLADLAALGVAPEDLLDRAVDIAADELELNEPAAVERVRALLEAELACQQR
jgi:hypothetical protein